MGQVSSLRLFVKPVSLCSRFLFIGVSRSPEASVNRSFTRSNATTSTNRFLKSSAAPDYPARSPQGCPSIASWHWIGDGRHILGCTDHPKAENVIASGTKMVPKVEVKNTDLYGKIGVASLASCGLYRSQSRADSGEGLLVSLGLAVAPPGALGTGGNSFASHTGFKVEPNASQRAPNGRQREPSGP